MPLRTKRWNDPAEPEDGLRILICRYRPRAVRKEDETWDEWWKDLSPSKELHADHYGKNGPPIEWDEFRTRFRQEMEAQGALLDRLAALVAAGQAVTVLCSSACADESHCHRSLVRQMVEARLAARQGAPDDG